MNFLAPLELRFAFAFAFLAASASAFCLSCCLCCPLLSSAAHFQSSMCAASVIFLSTRSSSQFLAPFPFWLSGFSLFSVRFVFSPAIFINKFACQMTLFMVFLYERHSHIYLDPRPSSFCHTLLTSLLKYVYMLKLVFCLCRLSSSFTRLALFVCLSESWQTKWIRNWVSGSVSVVIFMPTIHVLSAPTIPCYICCSSLILIRTRFLLDISNFIYAYYIQHLVTFLCICNYKGVQGVKPSFLAPSRRLVAEINALMCSALIIFTFSSHLNKQWP